MSNDFWQKQFLSAKKDLKKGGQVAYGASKVVGRAYAYIGALIRIFIGIGMFFWGIYLIVKTPEIDFNNNKIKDKTWDYVLGSLLIVGGIAIGVWGIVNAYLASKVGVYAAATGAGAIIHAI